MDVVVITVGLSRTRRAGQFESRKYHASATALCGPQTAEKTFAELFGVVRQEIYKQEKIDGVEC